MEILTGNWIEGMYEVRYEGKRLRFHKPLPSQAIEIVDDHGIPDKVFEFKYLGKILYVTIFRSSIPKPVRKKRTTMIPLDRQAIIEMINAGETAATISKKYPQYTYNCITQIKFRVKH